MMEPMDSTQLSIYCDRLIETISVITSMQPGELQGADAFVTEQVELFMEHKQCIVCEAHFPDFRDLQTHLQVHGDWMCHQFYPGLRCSECNAVFDTPEERIEHDRVHEPPVQPVYCNVCGKAFKTIGMLQRHEHSHREREHACGVQSCGKKMASLRQLIKHSEHMHKETTEERYACALCGIKFDDYMVLESHLTAIHRQSIEQPEPELPESSQVIMSRPRYSEDSPEVSQCRDKLIETIIVITSMQPGELQGVDAFVTEQAMFFMEHKQCMVCEADFPDLSDLLTHLQVHGDWMCHQFYPRLRCSECNAVFDTPEERIEHDRVHEPPVQPVYCNVCGKAFKTIGILLRHKNMHREREHACGVYSCGKKMASLRQLIKHSEHMHKETMEERYACALCGIKFDDYMVLESHLTAIHRQSIEQPEPELPESSQVIMSRPRYSEDSPEVSQCRDKLIETIIVITRMQPAELQGVDAFVTEQAMFFMEHKQCMVCEADFPDLSDLLTHLQVHGDWMCHQFYPRLRCSECNAVFDTPEERIEHDRVHEPPVQPVYCNVCGKAFKTIGILLRHKNMHREREHACGVQSCGKKMASLRQLIKHSEHMHKETKEMRYACALCGRKFDDYMVLESHLTAIHRQSIEQPEPELPESSQVIMSRPRYSEDSPEVSQCRDRLIETISVITRMQPAELQGVDAFVTEQAMLFMELNQCMVCEARFPDLSDLLAHLQVHGDWMCDQFYPRLRCSECNAVFDTPEEYIEHDRVHQSRVPTVQCNVCGKAFGTTVNLQRHRRVHREREHACGVQSCGQKMASLRQLIKHSEGKHKETTEMRYACALCGMKFDDITQLELHLIGEHRGIMPLPDGMHPIQP